MSRDELVSLPRTRSAREAVTDWLHQAREIEAEGHPAYYDIVRQQTIEAYGLELVQAVERELGARVKLALYIVAIWLCALFVLLAVMAIVSEFMYRRERRMRPRR